MVTEEKNRQIVSVLNPLVTGEELNAWVKKPPNFRKEKPKKGLELGGPELKT